MKRFFQWALIALLAGPATAQTGNDTRDLEFPPRVIVNTFRDNWFIGGGVGTNVYFGDQDRHMDLDARMHWGADLYVGKWFTPGLGVRAAYNGLAWKGVSDRMVADNFTGHGNREGWAVQKGKFGYAHVDMMLNILDMTTAYDAERVYSFIPFAGAGWLHSWDAPHRDELAVNAGIINRFRVNKRLYVNLELGAVLTKDLWDGERGGCRVDGIGQALVGISYRLGKPDWQENIVRFTGISQQELDRVNESVNNLRQENNSLRLENERLSEAAREVKTQVIAEKTMAPVIIVFELGKAGLSKQQRVNLGYAAKAMKDCNGRVFTLEGYADSGTGSAETNLRLCRQRASAVKDCLLNEYGVPESQIRIDVKGGVENMFYDDPTLSRAVIIR